MSERLIDQNMQSEDADAAMRPKTLEDFVGQQKGRENLAVFIEAAKKRGEDLGGASEKKKKKGRWDNLPGDGDSLAAAIKAKVAKKQKKQKR